MRLVNHLYTHIEVEISEGLGGGSRHYYYMSTILRWSTRQGSKTWMADGLSHNLSPLQEDLTGARWHGTLDQEEVPGWHASAYLAWMKGGSS